MSLNRVSADTSTDEILALLETDGYCIIESLVSDEVVEAILAEMAPHLAATPYCDEGSGAKTRRLGALIARSPSSHQVIAHPKLLEMANRVLRVKATSVQLNLTMMNCIGPGEKAQFLHRDELAWDGYPFAPDYPVELSTVWALDDFTEENGATRLVPGSHKSDRAPESYSQQETIAAEMSKGSLVVYTGKTVHGGGANRSQKARSGLLIDYTVGWLRQEENQYLTVPIEVARTLNRDLQRLMGYAMGAPGLGHTRSFEDPLVALYPEMGPTPWSSELIDDAVARSANLARAAAAQAKAREST